MEDRRRNTYIGLAVIALVALAIVALPSGGDFTRFVSDALQAAFLAAIAVSVARLYRSQSMWLSALSDRDRGILYGAGAIATLTIVADERWREIGNGGRVAQWCIVGACAFAAYWVWRESKRYSY
jgi:hypothetical protein